MHDKPEITEAGTRILRHGKRRVPRAPSRGDASNIAAISRHLEQHLGPIGFVFHELVSDLVHVDVHVVLPRPERDFYTLVTSGMSEAPMRTPRGVLIQAELVIALPPDWPLSREALSDENHYWPVRWLKELARFPHEYDTWLDRGHTVPNGDPPEPFAPGTGFCCMLLGPPRIAPEAFDVLTVSETRKIEFFCLYPLYREEVDFALRKGADVLFELLQDAGVSEIVDLGRRNTCV
jgi:hypothetical protein